MTYREDTYHHNRERQCRSMAENAVSADIRQRHQQLADLHARASAGAGMRAGD